MMILVTGGAGYVGSALVGDLLTLGHSVRSVDLLWFGGQPNGGLNLEVLKADVRSVEAEWLDGVDAVVHLAGLSNDPTADFAPEINNEYNVGATRTLGEAVALRAKKEHRSIRFLFASTCSVYHTLLAEHDVNFKPMTEDRSVAPSANYSRSKRLAEDELLRIAARFPEFCPVILRKGTLFGRSNRMRFDLVLNAFCLSAWKHRILTVHGHGEVWRPLVHVRDAVSAYLYLLTAPADLIQCQVFNLVHKNYRILELAHWVAEILEDKRKVVVNVKRDRRSIELARSYYVSGDKLATVVGFRPTRGTSEAVLELWDALERGTFGVDPEKDNCFFNIRQLEALWPEVKRPGGRE
jgi:nucleoside-diphosphate-sugar epimerase